MTCCFSSHTQTPYEKLLLSNWSEIDGGDWTLHVSCVFMGASREIRRGIIPLHHLPSVNHAILLIMRKPDEAIVSQPLAEMFFPPSV